MFKMFEKVIEYIRGFIPEYVYSLNDFYLFQGEQEGIIIKDWIFEFPLPTKEQLDAIIIVPEPVICAKDLLRRIEILEARLS